MLKNTLTDWRERLYFAPFSLAVALVFKIAGTSFPSVDSLLIDTSKARGRFFLMRSSNWFWPWSLIAWLVFFSVTLSSVTVRGANRWPDERVVGPFVFHADFSLQEYRQLLGEMADLQKHLVDLLEIKASKETIHLYLFARQTTYKGYVKQYFPQAPNRRALFVKGRGPGIVLVYRNRDFQIDLRHESTHAILHSTLPRVPLWLDEGLAEYFEVSPSRRAIENPHHGAIQRRARDGSLGRMESLEAIGDINKMGQKEYQQAWAWVHFMLHGPPAAREELVRYLHDLESRTSAGRLSERLRRRIPNLQQRFTEHFLAVKTSQANR